ncbi:hypothetical protein F442_01787 [Phytophthora nicotianae P10297]|uniref:Uncharacterized protein n=1 Tax=Phytophthora nicotianae P10297 TaxID=1317064 RepID=W3A440_PHYNI|nr:hypothetical protein F442_01787 [Phytophthora nicotianae P10297]
MSRELFETDNGDISSLRSTVVHFPGVESLRQVFEALWFYLTNMEISISERLGHITVREDYDMIDGIAYNARILSSDSNGIMTEYHRVRAVLRRGRSEIWWRTICDCGFELRRRGRVVSVELV